MHATTKAQRNISGFFPRLAGITSKTHELIKQQEKMDKKKTLGRKFNLYTQKSMCTKWLEQLRFFMEWPHYIRRTSLHREVWRVVLLQGDSQLMVCWFFGKTHPLNPITYGATCTQRTKAAHPACLPSERHTWMELLPFQPVLAPLPSGRFSL